MGRRARTRPFDDAAPITDGTPMRGRSHTMDELTTDREKKKQDGLTSKSRCRSLPRRLRMMQATQATAAGVNAVLVWACWAAVMILQKALGELGRRCGTGVSSAGGGGDSSWSQNVRPSLAEQERNMCVEERVGKGERNTEGGLSPSSAEADALESGLAAEDPWREMRKRHHEQEERRRQEGVEIELSTFSLGRHTRQRQPHGQKDQQQQQRQQQQQPMDERGLGLQLPRPLVVSELQRELAVAAATCILASGKGDGLDNSTAPTSPAESDHMRSLAAAVAVGAPTPAGANEPVLLGSAGGGDCCGLCGYTLEEGERVVRSPACGEGFMLHLECFDDSGVVFSDDADGGSLKYGCDCGQFHPGEGLAEGLYALSSPEPESPESSGWSSASNSSPESAESGETAAERLAWERDEEMMMTPRDTSGERAREEDALQACPSFAQADPSALAVVDGEVRLRAADAATTAPAEAAAAKMAEADLDPESLAVRFSRQDVLSRTETVKILRQGTAILDTEENVLELEGETVVVGDLHGQFFDLLNLLETYGKPPDRQYLFLGDYVDRGFFSCEVALYLVSLKVAFPRKVYLIRGNHETANQTAACGFKNECFAKYGSAIYDTFLECFSALPVCAVLSQEGQTESLFCVHGGISPRLKTLGDVRGLERRVEPEDGTLLADLLWSDPSDDPSVLRRSALRDRSNDKEGATQTGGSAKEGGGEVVGFTPNAVRGCSWSYNWKAVESFLKENRFRGMLRAHSVQGEGYHHHFRGHCPESSTGEGVSTVFSAPMYTTHSNRGGVLVVRGDGGVDPLGYDAAPEPALVNSVRAAVQRACPFMPTSLREWALLDGASYGAESPLSSSSSSSSASPSTTTSSSSPSSTTTTSSSPASSLSSFLSAFSSPFGRRRQEQPPSSSELDNKEALALRALWEAMSGGGETITADSLFAFDDVFGEGTDCLHAAAVLKTLSPPRRLFSTGDEEDAPAPATATMNDFLQVALALKRKSVAATAKPEATPLSFPEENDEAAASTAPAGSAGAAAEDGKGAPAEISNSSSSSSTTASKSRRRSKDKKRSRGSRRHAVTPARPTTLGTVIGSAEARKAEGPQAAAVSRTAKSDVAHDFVLRLQQLGCPM